MMTKTWRSILVLWVFCLATTSAKSSSSAAAAAFSRYYNHQKHTTLTTTTTSTTTTTTTTTAAFLTTRIPRGGGGYLPAGWNPFGYKISKLGEEYLSLGECLNSDVGRFLASLKTRKTLAAIKSQWIEIVKVTKTGQTMRIYRTIEELLQFCIRAKLID